MEPGLARLRSGFAVRGIDLSKAGATTFFDAATVAKSSVSFSANEAGWLIIAAPGHHMLPGEQTTLTPLTLTMERATPRLVGKFDLPDPLADSLQDIRIKSATAQAYFV
jgi:aminomethyltransferase